LPFRGRESEYGYLKAQKVTFDDKLATCLIHLNFAFTESSELWNGRQISSCFNFDSKSD